MKVSLIVFTYNWPEALRLCLESVRRQSSMPDEIIIADDGSTEPTAVLVREFAESCSVPVRHVWQEDLGFRKTLIANKAVCAATGDYIIQADGDLVLHQDFIKDHRALAKEGYFIRGGRSLVKEEQTAEMIECGVAGSQAVKRCRCENPINAFRIPLIAPLLCRDSDDVLHVKGCNMSFWKKDFVAVNGYNNDLSGWGHEDIELAVRLYNSGVKMRKAKFKAIAFHLYHPYKSRDNEADNFKVFDHALRMKVKWAEKGYADL